MNGAYIRQGGRCYSIRKILNFNRTQIGSSCSSARLRDGRGDAGVWEGERGELDCDAGVASRRKDLIEGGGWEGVCREEEEAARAEASCTRCLVSSCDVTGRGARRPEV